MTPNPFVAQTAPEPRNRLVQISRIALLGLLGLLAGCSEAQVGSISSQELESRIQAGQAPLILDVRTPEEFAGGHVPGAVNMPYTQVPRRASDLGVSPDTEIVVYCQSGGRAGAAEQSLASQGYSNIVDLKGHMLGWRNAGQTVEN